jgi:glyceraldehyde 3-phosphate dehydrogenase
MIPTTTGAAKAVALVLPQLKGKLDGVSIRVPTPDVSFVDLSFEAKRQVTVEEINDMIKKASDGNLKGILTYTEEELVSIDFTHDTHSSIFDMTQTKVLGGNFVRIGSWYDNEWGFSNRMLDATLVWMSK